MPYRIPSPPSSRYGACIELRGRLSYALAQFAARFGVSVATLRHWERGDRNLQGPALVLLNLIDRDPAGVMRALS